MRLAVILIGLSLAAALAAQAPPSYEARDVRPQGAAEPHPLLPGMSVWIFGEHLGPSPGCAVDNASDPKTYRSELCGVQVLVGGLPAKLLYVSPGQINLVLPSEPWQDEFVDVEVIRDGQGSRRVPVRFGADRIRLSIDPGRLAGMPVWLRVERPWGMGSLRYPFHAEPWAMGLGLPEVRFEGRDLKPLPLPTYAALHAGMSVALPSEPPKESLDRIPLHLLYPLDRPGRYEVRYQERWPKERSSEWTAFTIEPSTASQRAAWFEELIQEPPEDAAALVADYLPNLLARRDAAALLALEPYLDHPELVVRRYAGYGLYYFDVELRKRVLPGREPPPGFVR